MAFFLKAHEKGWLGSAYLFPRTNYQGGTYLPLTASRPIPDLAQVGWDNRIASAWVRGRTILYDQPGFQGRRCTLIGPAPVGGVQFPTLVAPDGFTFNNQASSAEHFD